MKVGNKMVVELDYKLQLDDAKGQMVEETYGREPLVFICGIGMMLPAFETKLADKEAGQEFSFGLTAVEAYGETQAEAIIDIPIENFKVDGKIDRDALTLGTPLQIKDQEGRLHQGVIVKAGIDELKIDFNHPMAGQNLFFTGEIKSIREASETELEHGHVHGPGGHNH